MLIQIFFRPVSGGDVTGFIDIRIAAGYMQFSHDNLMGENYDISAKLIDCEMWLTSYCRFLYGLGFNLLGYQEREYPDTTILRDLDIIGLRFDFGGTMSYQLSCLLP
jgi:hypothetical protein